jgi:hypothetical protein
MSADPPATDQARRRVDPKGFHPASEAMPYVMSRDIPRGPVETENKAAISSFPWEYRGSPRVASAIR